MRKICTWEIVKRWKKTIEKYESTTSMHTHCSYTKRRKKKSEYWRKFRLKWTKQRNKKINIRKWLENGKATHTHGRVHGQFYRMERYIRTLIIGNWSGLEHTAQSMLFLTSCFFHSYVKWTIPYIYIYETTNGSIFDFENFIFQERVKPT